MHLNVFLKIISLFNTTGEGVKSDEGAYFLSSSSNAAMELFFLFRQKDLGLDYYGEEEHSEGPMVINKKIILGYTKVCCHFHLVFFLL